MKKAKNVVKKAPSVKKTVNKPLPPPAPSSSKTTTTAQAQAQTPATTPQISLKFPYPVLNDKRDFKTILDILTQKEDELNKKMRQTKIGYKKTDKNDTKRKEKLKILYKNYKSQLSKIDKQLEYIKINIKIKKILKTRQEKNLNDYKKEQYDELNEQLSRLTFFMKEANRSFLRESKLQQQAAAVAAVNKVNNEGNSLSNEQQKQQQNEIMDISVVDKALNTSDQLSNQNVAFIGPTNMPPNYYQQFQAPPLHHHHQQQQQPHNVVMSGYNGHPWQMHQTQVMYHHPQMQQPSATTAPASVYYPQQQQQQQQKPQTALLPTPAAEPFVFDPEKHIKMVQDNLIYSIAQTAAAAHATAAITAAALNPPPPPPSTTGADSTVISTAPTKIEIDKAASTFEKYKSKIQFLLKVDKNIVKYTNSLKTLTTAYNQEEDDDDEDEEDDKKNSSEKNHGDLTFKKQYHFENVDDDDDDDDDDEIDMGSDAEIEIVLKSNSNNYNYVIPSNKSCGLQSSLNMLNLNDKYSLIDLTSLNDNYKDKVKPPLFTAQRSTFAVTFMGTPSILSKESTLKNILFGKKYKF